MKLHEGIICVRRIIHLEDMNLIVQIVWKCSTATYPSIRLVLLYGTLHFSITDCNTQYYIELIAALVHSKPNFNRIFKQFERFTPRLLQKMIGKIDFNVSSCLINFQLRYNFYDSFFRKCQ